MRNILHVIHLPHRTDRLPPLLEQMKQQNIQYKLWDGIIEKPTVAGISKAHKAVVRFARDRGLKRITIAEDDVQFTAPGAWKFYLSKMPKIFDLYCGVIYHGKVNEKNRIVVGMSGTNTLYTVHENFYDTFLSTENKLDLDRALGKLACVYNYYVCNPHVVVQTGGYSDHHKQVLQYSAFEEGKKFYGR